MAPLTTLALSLTCLAAASATPTLPPRNTIAFEETLQGEVFENVDIFNQLRDDDAALYRLPTTTRPSRYTVLWSVIDFTNFNFGGMVQIQLSATQAGVTEVVIHSQDLTIVTFNLALGATNVPVTLVEEPEYQFLRFQLQNNATLVLNQVYTLTINFEAPLRNDMYGIYRSWFKENNETRWMATTQFQATAGRQAFPCYDEPSFKAVFDITIRRPTAYRSWSNTRIASTQTVIANTQDDLYHSTPLMSTYLIAIIVAEYDAIEALDANGNVLYDVIARPGAISAGQGQYAFDVGQELLAEMSNHTGIDFYSVDPNLKMTQAAIPDFGAGAMENWGLLTYREAYLLYDANHTSNYFQQLIAYILSHEIAHMWFGNLVTCDWWDVLWLNEGFARYYQYFLTHWVEDHMGLETRFITEQIHTSLLADSANNPHPLSNPGIGSQASVSGMFSTLSYNKGAAIIRMTEHLLGFDVHREGLRNYLSTFAHQTVLPIDLFNSLQAAAVSAGAIAEYGPNFSVVDYYRSWTEVAGVPVLNVHVNHQTGDMTIQQRRFNINTGYSSVTSNWIVPITFATASNPDFNNTKPTHIVRDAVTVINRGSVGDEWVVFNKQQTGYYRVNYDDYTWDLIVMALRSDQRTQIHEYNRAQIVNDVFQFARSGLMTYNRAFNILSFLENETSYAPWVAAITGFSWIRNRLAGTASLEPINALLTRWATNVMNDLTYTETTTEDFMRQYLRWQLAPVMCATNVAACRASAAQQYAALRTLGTEVPVNSRNFVYCNALRDGTTEDFDFLWNRFQNHNVYTEKITILMTIGCTPHQTSLNTFLDGIVQENELVRPQDYTTAFNNAVTGNEGNTQLVFTYIQNNIAAVTAAFGSIAFPLSYVSARLRSEQEITDFQTWVTNNAAALGDDPSVAAAIAAGAESSRQSILWAAAVSTDLNEYVTVGDLPVAATTTQAPLVTNPTTLGVPSLVEPVAPALPDSAVTSVVSVFAIFAAVAANLMV